MVIHTLYPKFCIPFSLFCVSPVSNTLVRWHLVLRGSDVHGDDDDAWGAEDGAAGADDAEDWGDDGGDDAGDWGEEGDDSAWNDPSSPAGDAKVGPKSPKSQVNKGMAKVVNQNLIVDYEYLKAEVHRRAAAVSETLDVPPGVAVHMLRGYKWMVSKCQNAYLGGAGSESGTRKRVTHPAKELPTSGTVKCMFYVEEKRASPAKPAASSRAATGLDQLVVQMVQAKKNQMQIISALRKAKKNPKGYNPRDIMAAYQRAMKTIAESNENRLGKQQQTLCAKNKGLVPVQHATGLRCGHWACHDCWRGVLQSEMRGSRECIMLKCQVVTCQKNHRHKSDLGCFCEELVPREVFAKYVDAKALERYDHWMARSFAESVKAFTACPASDCDYWAQLRTNNSNITCVCKHEFCFNCQSETHNPIPCQQYATWKRWINPHNQDELWMQMNTTPCPKCKVAIEKNRACLHMTCRCGHEFCWACRKTWNKSGHSYYNCPAYKKSTEGAKMDKVQKSANRQLGKCRFYKKLVEQSEKDIKEIEAFRQKKENEIGTLKLSLRDYDYVIQAADALISTKRALINMQIIAFFFSGGGGGKGDAKSAGPVGKSKRPRAGQGVVRSVKKQLYEHQLREMVNVTTQLLKILDPKTDIRKLERKEIVSRTVACSKFIKSVVEEIESGTYDEYILDEPDQSVEQWFCIRCEHSNPFSAFVCQSGTCDACQVHGEFACLRCRPKR